MEAGATVTANRMIVVKNQHTHRRKQKNGLENVYGIRIGGSFNAAYAVLADEVNCLKNLKRKYHARKNA